MLSSTVNLTLAEIRVICSRLWGSVGIDLVWYPFVAVK